MPHLDEGTIHELLDGELEPAASEAARAHLERCTACHALYDEERSLLGEADRMITLLDDPAGAAKGGSETGAPARPVAPLVLIPVGHERGEGVRPRRRNYFWAAGLLVAVGTGYTLMRASREAPPLANMTLVSFPQAPAQPVRADAPATRDSAPAVAAAKTTATPPTEYAARAAAADKVAEREQRAPTTPSASNTAGALAQLPAPAPAAEPPSLDVRAGVTSRIGLDEARRELGSPLHGIDGLTPKLVGLVPGQAVPGADPSRNVVRAVYVDAGGRTFYLDQQRMAGTSAARRSAADGSTAGEGMIRGDVQLFLHGQVPPDSLRALAPRIR